MGIFSFRVAAIIVLAITLAYSCLRQDVRRVDDVYLTNAYIARLTSQIGFANSMLARSLAGQADEPVRNGDATLGVLLALEAADAAARAAEQGDEFAILETRDAIYWPLATARYRWWELAHIETGEFGSRAPYLAWLSETEGRMLLGRRLFSVAQETGETGSSTTVTEIPVVDPAGSYDLSNVVFKSNDPAAPYIKNQRRISRLDLRTGRGAAVDWGLGDTEVSILDAEFGNVAIAEAFDSRQPSSRQRLIVADENGVRGSIEFAENGAERFSNAYVSAPNEVTAIIRRQSDPAEPVTWVFRRLSADATDGTASLRQVSEVAIKADASRQFTIQNESRVTRYASFGFQRGSLVEPSANLAAFIRADLNDDGKRTVEIHDMNNDGAQIATCRGTTGDADSARFVFDGAAIAIRLVGSGDLAIHSIRKEGCPEVALIRRAGGRISQIFELRGPEAGFHRIMLTDNDNRDYIFSLLTNTINGEAKAAVIDLRSGNYDGVMAHQTRLTLAAATAIGAQLMPYSLVTASGNGQVSVWGLAEGVVNSKAETAPVLPGAPIGKADYARMVGENLVGAVGRDGVGVVDLNTGESFGAAYSGMSQFEISRDPRITHVSPTGKHAHIGDIGGRRMAVARFGGASDNAELRYFTLSSEDFKDDTIEEVRFSAGDSYLIVTTQLGDVAFADIDAAFASPGDQFISLKAVMRRALIPTDPLGATRGSAAYDVLDHGAGKGLLFGAIDGRLGLYDLAKGGDPIVGPAAAATILTGIPLTQNHRAVALSVSRSGKTLGVYSITPAGRYFTRFGLGPDLRSKIQSYCNSAAGRAQCKVDAAAEGATSGDATGQAAAAEFDQQRAPPSPTLSPELLSEMRAAVAPEFDRQTYQLTAKSALNVYLPTVIISDSRQFADRLFYIADGADTFLVNDAGRILSQGQEYFGYDRMLFDDFGVGAILDSSGSGHELYILSGVGDDGMFDSNRVTQGYFMGELSRLQTVSTHEESPLKYDRIAVAFENGEVAAINVTGAKYQNVIAESRALLSEGRNTLSPGERLRYGALASDSGIDVSENYQERRRLECPGAATLLYLEACKAVGLEERSCLAPVRVFRSDKRRDGEEIYSKLGRAVDRERLRDSCRFAQSAPSHAQGAVP